MHCNIAIAARDASSTLGVGKRKQGEFRTMTKKIAALKDQSWVYLVAAFAVLIFVGIATS